MSDRERAAAQEEALTAAWRSFIDTHKPTIKELSQIIAWAIDEKIKQAMRIRLGGGK